MILISYFTLRSHELMRDSHHSLTDFIFIILLLFSVAQQPELKPIFGLVTSETTKRVSGTEVWCQNSSELQSPPLLTPIVTDSLKRPSRCLDGTRRPLASTYEQLRKTTIGEDLQSMAKSTGCYSHGTIHSRITNTKLPHLTASTAGGMATQLITEGWDRMKFSQQPRDIDAVHSQSLQAVENWLERFVCRDVI